MGAALRNPASGQPSVKGSATQARGAESPGVWVLGAAGPSGLRRAGITTSGQSCWAPPSLGKIHSGKNGVRSQVRSGESGVPWAPPCPGQPLLSPGTSGSPRPCALRPHCRCLWLPDRVAGIKAQQVGGQQGLLGWLQRLCESAARSSGCSCGPGAVSYKPRAESWAIPEGGLRPQTSGVTDFVTASPSWSCCACHPGGRCCCHHRASKAAPPHRLSSRCRRCRDPSGHRTLWSLLPVSGPGLPCTARSG